MSFPWLLLIVAGLLEVVWALALKASDGFTQIGPTVVFAVFTVASLVLLSMALRMLPVGTAYAVWTGIGAVGTAVLGMILFGESASPVRLACIGLIVVGIVGLQLTSTTA